tara:strand:+ start:173 stop:610 length:438 start_codon:yes stop_codon:yes gene_type:complete
MIQQFTKYGYSCIASTANITSSYSVVALTNLPNANKKSAVVPDDCFLESIELQLSGIDATSDTVTIFLARDSAGLIPITSDELSGASQTVTTSVGGATTGGVSFTIGKDYHFDTTVTNATSGTLYLCAKSSATHTIEKAWLNWRA